MSGALPVKKVPPAELTLELQPRPGDAPSFRQQMGHISRHSAVFFLGTIFTAATGYLFKVYLARVLGAEALGIYALGMTIVGLLGIFNALGLPYSAVRFVASYTATGRFDLLRGFLVRSVSLLLIFNFLLGGAVLLVGPWVAIHVYHTPALSRYLGLFALIMIFGALTGFLGQVLTGYKDVARRTVITNFIGSPLTMIFTLGLVGAGLSLWGVISFSAAVFAMDSLGFVMSQADKVLIGFYLDARELGIYAMAAALVAFVPAVLQSVNQIFSPTIADLHARGQRELLGRLFQTLTKWILGLTLPLGCLIIIFARDLMRIFGPEFETGWPILVVGTLGQLINCGVGSVGYLLLMSGQQRRLIRIQAIMAGVMVGLSFLLIPKLGLAGAALSAALTNAVSNVWYLREVWSKLGLSPYNRSYFRLLLPLAGNLCVLLLLRFALSAILPQWMVLAIGLSLAYLVFVLAALAVGLDDDDRLIARALWSRLLGMVGAGVSA